MPLLAPRPPRYVPRHSTREPAPQRSASPPRDVLASVLVALGELDRDLDLPARQS